VEAAGGGSREFFGAVGSGTIIDDCHFVGTGVSFDYLVNSKGAPNFHFTNNHVNVTIPTFFKHLYVDAGSHGNNLKFTGNTIKVANGVGGKYTVDIEGAGASQIGNVTVGNNTVIGDTGNTKSFYVDRITNLVGFGNITDRGYAGIDLGGGGTITVQKPAVWGDANI
jgi:hypothetical protein